MTKRPRRVLRTMYASRRARPTSLADGPGFLYVFIDNGNKWKVGMSKNFARRRAEWNRECPCPNRVWMRPVAVKRRRRAEALAHILLELACFDRPYDYCPHCRKTHREVFIFNGNQANVWNSIVVGWIAISTNIIH
ncbi:hypothetical protein F5878DRAFT_645900 [Lentinula raphanica]|uniref:Bacteriophage T5 Orf172 DNA-binding domain-containing protein n=1 Tax=Lentinula raphanica TaxID=153919 RepID=A0AA38UCK0_9AGAR|nr:hypothetical protein C8R42DRAFT_646762 [Lentinula raphanica]KAJ3756469.1 hypothetical protein EV360DRAFT_71974 [Lentinula raphanica]KAJ3833492.1 hypothetical protein F5878DRAFT_645900 [Lentinula raphanica]